MTSEGCKEGELLSTVLLYSTCLVCEPLYATGIPRKDNRCDWGLHSRALGRSRD